MTFPNGGQRDETNPNRSVSAPGGHYFQDPHEVHQQRAAATAGGGSWPQGFVGTYRGFDNGSHWFTSPTGDSSDSVTLPAHAWGGSGVQQNYLGQRMAVLPTMGTGEGADVRDAAHARPLNADNESHYSHLPGYSRP